MSEPAKTNEAQQHLIDTFRAWLQTVITAKQFGQSARLQSLPGAKTPGYCVALAKLPDNTLARELSTAALAITEEIEQAAIEFYRPLYQKKITDPATLAEHERILEQLDLALAFILRQLRVNARFRAKSTKCSDLLCEVICELADHGPDAVALIRRYQSLFPDQFHGSEATDTDDDILGSFAWDTYQRVEALDRLADELPHSVKTAARFMHGWPMLTHRHTNNRKRFEELATRLELGVDYPLDASEGARFRPVTPLVRYLDPLFFKINYIRSMMINGADKSEEKERADIRLWWWVRQGENPSDDVVELLRAVPKLPPLTKKTANEWAEKAVVPVIMATDARDWKNCGEPVLQRIARQAGVKSRATFKSRLLSAVASTLRRLARPA